MSISVLDPLSSKASQSLQLESTSIHSIPAELILNILSRTKKEDVFHFAITKRVFLPFVQDSYLWSLLFLRDFPQRLPTVVLPNCSNHWKQLYRVPVVTRANIKKKTAQITTLPSLAANVTSLCYTGRLLLTGDQTGAVKVRVKDKDGKFQEVQVIEACKDGFFQLSPQQDYLLFQAANALKIYNKSESGEFKEIQSLNVDGSEIRRFKMDRDVLTISTSENSLVYRKGQDGLFEESTRLEGFHLVLVSGEYIFATRSDEQVQILKKNAKGEYQLQMNYLNGSPSVTLPAWIFFENGHLILATFDGTIKIWKEEKDGSFTGPKVVDVGDFMNSVICFDAKGDYLFVGMQKGQLIVLKKDAKGEFQIQPKSDNHRDRINVLTHYENYLISGSTDGTVKVWEKDAAGIYSLLQTLSDPELKVSVTSLSMEDNKLVIAYFNGAVKIWDFFPKA